MLQADGLYDLEKGENIGNEEDMWQPGMALTPNYDGNTFPNTDSYQMGNVQQSGVVIEILEVEGRNYNVQITVSTRMGELYMRPPIPAGPVQPTPVKEKPAEATEQFEVPDAEGHHISGKLPDLPWQDGEAGDRQNAKGEETEYAIDILDNVSSSQGSKSWAMSVASGTIMCLASAMMLFY